jgi:hypothetical protein
VSVRAAAVAGCLAAAVLLGAAPAPGSERGAPPPTRIGVRGDEFDLTLSRTRVVPGPAVIQFQNSGEDPHDLKVKRVGSASEIGTGELGPGDVQNLPQMRLRRASSYRLWCSLENHASYGMEATLRVKRRRR